MDHATPQPAETVARDAAGPKLWPPDTAANLSILLTPMFGAWIQARNWQALGRPDRAMRSRCWMIAGFLLLPGALFLTGRALTPDYTVYTCGMLLLVAWYILDGRVQVKYVKDSFGTAYERRAWDKPVLSALGAIVGVLLLVRVAVPRSEGEVPVPGYECEGPEAVPVFRPNRPLEEYFADNGLGLADFARDQAYFEGQGLGEWSREETADGAILTARKVRAGFGGEHPCGVGYFAASISETRRGQRVLSLGKCIFYEKDSTVDSEQVEAEFRAKYHLGRWGGILLRSATDPKRFFHLSFTTFSGRLDFDSQALWITLTAEEVTDSVHELLRRAAEQEESAVRASDAL